MTTLVTGAAGYIGSAVVRELLDKGKEVRCLVRQTSRLKHLEALDVEVVYGDIRDMDSLHRAVDGCNNVYHLAAIYANWLPDAGVMFQVNEEGTRNVLTACETAGVKKIVYCSSVAALGAHGKNPADESAVFNLNSTKDHYYISKYRAKQVALEYVLGNRNVSIKEYFDLIVKVAGRGKSPFIKIPRWVAVFSGYGYQLLARITGQPPVTSASWVRVGSHYSWWDCSKAREQLSLGQRPLEESIADAVKWFEENGYV